MQWRIALLALLLAGLPAGAAADYLQASRPAIVRDGHSGDAAELARLARGETIDLASSRKTDGYYHVRLDDGADGWIYGTFVRRLPGARPGHGNATGASDVVTPPSGAGALDASAYVSTTCPPEGKTQLVPLRELNRLKNRSVGPSPSVVVGTPLEDLVFPGDDRTRWRADRAIEISGYVRDVKKGGVETCNCGAQAEDDRDTHIELVSDPNDAEQVEPVIVEVTPTWRRFMKSTKGVDWSTQTLQATIKGKWVKVRGWMLFDTQHTQNATNTTTSGTNVWRATCWEIHPITALEVVPAPAR